MRSLGIILLVLGGLIALLGVILLAADKVPFLGRLPGDIHIPGERTSFHFPIVTCLVISLFLTLLLNGVLRILR